MNSLAFVVRKALDSDDESRVCVPVIDGISLIDRLSEFERSFAHAEGSPHLAGNYDGLPLFNVSLPSQHWFGGDSVYHLRDGRSLVLGCECGVEDCWPFLARITATEDAVRWWDFRQPYRADLTDRSVWDYRIFPSFTFRRHAYDRAVEGLPREVFRLSGPLKA